MDPKRYAANKFNALLSTGPRTPEGKRRSSLNATKHSLTGKIHIATPEDSAAFDRHCESYREALAPVGTLEQELAHEIAEDRWRLKRARSLENSIFAEGHHQHADESASGHPEIDAALAEGKIWVEQARNLQLLTLYENRIRRAIERNTSELTAMQTKREAAHAKAQQEAILFSRLAKSDGQTYNAAPDFTPAKANGWFVFYPPKSPASPTATIVFAAPFSSLNRTNSASCSL